MPTNRPRRFTPELPPKHFAKTPHPPRTPPALVKLLSLKSVTTVAVDVGTTGIKAAALERLHWVENKRRSA
jgi:hypothetical protein